MKFGSILAFVSLALAAPVSLDERDPTVVGTVTNAVTTAGQTANTNANAINSALSQVKNSVSAQVQAQVNANLAAIAAALTSAGSTVVSSTTGAAGGIKSSASNLSQAEINNLTTAVGVVQQLLSTLSGSITNVVNALAPATQSMTGQEVAAAKAAINPFVVPVQNYATAVTQQSGAAGTSVTALQNALSQMTAVFQNVQSSLGLPAVTTS